MEDELYLRELYSDILKEAGYEVVLAEEGAKALELLTEGGYDLVLLDIMLPKMDGLSIMKELKSQPPRAKNKAIVVLSNLGHNKAISEAITLGARGYMIKSDYTPEELLNEVKHYLSEG